MKVNKSIKWYVYVQIEQQLSIISTYFKMYISGVLSIVLY